MDRKKNVAIQTYNTTEQHKNCLSCSNTIITPLCPHCIAKEFKEWVKSYPELEKDTIHKLDHFIKNSQKDLGASCIKCNKKVYICVYCITEYLYQLIKEAGAGPKILAEFLFMFNFDFKRTGYIHELEALGGY